MEEKKQNEKLLSRREFFKSASKKLLPLFGSIIIGSNIPIKANTIESNWCTGKNGARQ